MAARKAAEALVAQIVHQESGMDVLADLAGVHLGLDDLSEMVDVFRAAISAREAELKQLLASGPARDTRMIRAVETFVAQVDERIARFYEEEEEEDAKDADVDEEAPSLYVEQELVLLHNTATLLDTVLEKLQTGEVLGASQALAEADSCLARLVAPDTRASQALTSRARELREQAEQQADQLMHGMFAVEETSELVVNDGSSELSLASAAVDTADALDTLPSWTRQHLIAVDAFLEAAIMEGRGAQQTLDETHRRLVFADAAGAAQDPWASATVALNGLDAMLPFQLRVLEAPDIVRIVTEKLERKARSLPRWICDEDGVASFADFLRSRGSLAEDDVAAWREQMKKAFTDGRVNEVLSEVRAILSSQNARSLASVETKTRVNRDFAKEVRAQEDWDAGWSADEEEEGKEAVEATNEEREDEKATAQPELMGETGKGEKSAEKERPGDADDSDESGDWGWGDGDDGEAEKAETQELGRATQDSGPQNGAEYSVGSPDTENIMDREGSIEGSIEGTEVYGVYQSCVVLAQYLDARNEPAEREQVLAFVRPLITPLPFEEATAEECFTASNSLRYLAAPDSSANRRLAQSLQARGMEKLHAHLDELLGLGRRSGSATSFTEENLHRVADWIHQVGAARLPRILSRPRLFQAVGGLLEKVVHELLDEMATFDGISVAQSEQYARAMKTVTPLESLFIVEPDEPPLAALYVPSWIKFSYLIEILEANLNDIMYLWREGLLVDYTPAELARLIRALFADSPKRRECLQEIETHGPE